MYTQHTFIKLLFNVADVAGLVSIEGEVADRSNKAVDATSDHGKEEVCKSSASESFGLKRSVVNDQATDPTKEEGKQETSKICAHCENPPFSNTIHRLYTCFSDMSITFKKKSLILSKKIHFLFIFSKV